MKPNIYICFGITMDYNEMTHFLFVLSIYVLQLAHDIRNQGK